MATNTKSKRTQYDVRFFKTFPGIFVIIQLTCCAVGFLFSMGGLRYSVSSSHGFFLFASALACSTCTLWTVVHFCEVKSVSHLKGVDWNRMGLIHSGAHTLLLVIASSCMIDRSYHARSLRVAGVFGFFGFTAFLVHFLWEATRYAEAKMPAGAALRASVSRGHNRDRVVIASAAAEEGDDENCLDPIVGGAYNPRPTSLYDAESQAPAESAPKKGRKPTDFSDSDSFDSDDSGESIPGKGKEVYSFA